VTVSTGTTSASAQPEVFSTWRSVLTLSRQAQQQCLNVHHLHRLVLNGFRPPGIRVEAPPPANVLFAAAREPAGRAGAGRPQAGVPVQVVVQTPQEPDWQPLLDTGTLRSAGTFRAEQRLEPGAELDVKVMANPTVRLRRSARRQALRDPGDCADWLGRQLDRHGLHLTPHPVTVLSAEYLTGTTGRGEELTIVCRQMTARAVIHDPKAARTALAVGIGPAKPFGCGLLITRSPP